MWWWWLWWWLGRVREGGCVVVCLCGGGECGCGCGCVVVWGVCTWRWFGGGWVGWMAAGVSKNGAMLWVWGFGFSQTGLQQGVVHAAGCGAYSGVQCLQRNGVRTVGCVQWFGVRTAGCIQRGAYSGVCTAECVHTAGSLSEVQFVQRGSYSRGAVPCGHAHWEPHPTCLYACMCLFVVYACLHACGSTRAGHRSHCC